MIVPWGARVGALSTRGHGGVLGAVLLAYAVRSLGAALLSLPVVTAVAGTGVGHFEAGDAKLFEAGGLFLVELWIRQRAALPAILANGLAGSAVLAWLGLIPTWYLLVALRARADGGGERRLSAPRAWLQLGVLGVLGWLWKVLGVLVVASAAWSAASWFDGTSDERWSDAALLLVLGSGAALALVMGGVWDLARAAVVANGLGAVEALKAGLEAFRQRLAQLGSKYGASCLARFGLLLAGALLVAELEVERDEFWRSALAAGMHQLVILSSILLRAWWLAAAVRAVGEPASRSHAEAFL